MVSASTARTAIIALGLAIIQLAAVRFAPYAWIVRIVLPATIAAVPVALWPFRRRLGIWIMTVGLMANLAAVLANGGLMPITEATVASAVGYDRAARYTSGAWLAGSKDVLLAEGSGHAVALGDAIVIHVGGGGFVASAGDVVVAFGLVVLAAEASLAFQRDRRCSADLGRDPSASASANETEGGAVTSS
jgi:hypothetical protein